MATLYGKNYSTSGGTPGSAGDNSVRVDRPNESLTGQATTTNMAADGYSPLTQTRGNFDSFKAIGKVSRQLCQIDTSGTSFNSPSTDVRRAAAAGVL